MKVYKLSLQEYEHLMAMRDIENTSLPITSYVFNKFRGKLKHSYNTSSEFSKTDPGTYKCFNFTVAFEQEQDLTWFILNL